MGETLVSLSLDGGFACFEWEERGLVGVLRDVEDGIEQLASFYGLLLLGFAGGRRWVDGLFAVFGHFGGGCCM